MTSYVPLLKLNQYLFCIIDHAARFVLNNLGNFWKLYLLLARIECHGSDTFAWHICPVQIFEFTSYVFPGCYVVLLQWSSFSLYPDQAFQNFRASKSVDLSKCQLTGFYSSKLQNVWSGTLWLSRISSCCCCCCRCCCCCYCCLPPFLSSCEVETGNFAPS